MRNIALILLTAFIFSSCVGLASEIHLRPDGSGSMSLEYRISRELESLGKLDGNERWPPVPAGKADFERTAARLPGLTLKSFTTKTTEKDIINRATLDFANLEALVRFLNGSVGDTTSGQGASLSRDGAKTRLTLRFSAGDGGGVDPALLALAASVMEGYVLDFSLTTPVAPELRVLDASGGVRREAPAGTVTVKGNRAAFSAPMAELLAGTEPVILEILW